MQLLLRAMRRLPLATGVGLTVLTSLALAKIAAAMEMPLPGGIGPQAIPVAAAIFALSTVVASLIAWPLRLRPLLVLVLALALACGLQLLLFNVFGSFVVDEFELERNRGFMQVGLALEASSAMLAGAVWSALSTSGVKRGHVV